MEDDGAAQNPRGNGHGQTDEASFGENHIRPKADEDEESLEATEEDEKRIDEIRPRKVAPEFPGKNGFEGDAFGHDQAGIEPRARTDVKKLDVLLLKFGGDSEVRDNVSSGPPAGKDDAFHLGHCVKY